jgi:hypothetical protein
MNNYIFLGLFYYHTFTVILCMIISLFIYFITLRSYFISILDPFFLSAVFSGFGFFVVLFLYITKNIEFHYFLSYILTQLFLYFGFVSGNKSLLFKTSIKITFGNNKNFKNVLFVLSMFIFIFLQILVYIISGIPLFMKSRLETFIGGSGYGLVSRFIDVSKFFAFFIALIFLTDRNDKKNILKRIFIILSIVFFLVSSVLSGSKSSFLIFGYIFFCYVIMTDNNKHIYYLFKKNEKIIVFIAIFVAIIINSYRSNGLMSAISSFFLRFINSGDVYWYAYPNGCIEQLSKEHPWRALFTDFLGLTRIIPWKELPTAIGIDLYKMHHSIDTIGGPNARHNVFGYIYFGYYGSMIFSFIIGFIIGRVRKIFLNINNKSLPVILFISYLYVSIYSFEADPMYALSLINSLLIVFPCLIFLSLIICEIIKRRDVL